MEAMKQFVFSTAMMLILLVPESHAIAKYRMPGDCNIGLLSQHYLYKPGEKSAIVYSSHDSNDVDDYQLKGSDYICELAFGTYTYDRVMLKFSTFEISNCDVQLEIYEGSSFISSYDTPIGSYNCSSRSPAEEGIVFKGSKALGKRIRLKRSTKISGGFHFNFTVVPYKPSYSADCGIKCPVTDVCIDADLCQDNFDDCFDGTDEKLDADCKATDHTSIWSDIDNEWKNTDIDDDSIIPSIVNKALSIGIGIIIAIVVVCVVLCVGCIVGIVCCVKHCNKPSTTGRTVTTATTYTAGGYPAQQVSIQPPPGGYPAQPPHGQAYPGGYPAQPAPGVYQPQGMNAAQPAYGQPGNMTNPTYAVDSSNVHIKA